MHATAPWYPGYPAIISHDRWFLGRVATHTLAFEGESQAYWFEGNYSEYEADRPTRIRYHKLKLS